MGDIQQRQVDSFFRFSNEITSTTDPGTLYRKIVEHAKEIFDLDFSTLLLLNEDKSQLIVRDTIGFPESFIGTFSLTEGEGLATYVIAGRRPETVLDYKTETRFSVPPLTFEKQISSAVSVPMMLDGEPFGVLIGHTINIRKFSDDDIRLFQNMANLAAVTIRNALNLHMLREAEAAWELTFNAVVDSIMVIDNAYHVRLMNRAAREQNHCGSDSREQHFCYQISHCRNTPCDGVEHPCPLKAARESEKPVTVIHTHRDVSGAEYTVEIHASPFYDSSGNFDGIIEISRDITAKIKLEQQKDKLEVRLAQQQKEESILTLASGIAHDFNNILMSVLGNAELLKLKLGNAEKEQALADNIIHSSERMASLTSQLLAYAKGGMYRQQLVAVEKVIREVLAVAGTGDVSGITIDLDLADDLWYVCADPGQMNQALSNIVVNAFEAMEQTGGQLSIHADNETKNAVWECSTLKHEHPAGDYIHLVVTDTGPGIPPDLQPKIFDPFYTTKFLGRGLGLAAAAGIFQSHKGCISVESESGKGSSFHIYLPKAPSDIVKKAVQPSRVKILVVDDEVQITSLLREMLTQFGYDVITADNGTEALELFRKEKERISMAVLDIQMPGMSGKTLFMELKTLNPALKVIISSGYDEQVALAGMEAVTPDGFIKKPFRVEALKKMIQERLS